MSIKIKRMSSFFLTLVILLGTFLPLSVSAAEITMDLNNCEISWDYTLTDEEGNAFSAAYGLNAADDPFGNGLNPIVRKMHDYTAKRNGLSGDKSNWVYGADFVYCFCIEHGTPLPNNNEYSGSASLTHGNKYEMLSESQKDLLKLALTYGYTNRTDLVTSKDANACYSATQLIIWQITLGFRSSPTELNDKTYPISGYSGTMTEQYTRNKYLKHYYDLILSDMANHYTRPSFTTYSSGTAKTYEMEYINGQYKLELTDSNHVLSKYYVSSSGSASATISGNTLTITSSKPITSDITIKLNRNTPSTNDTTGFLIWSVPGKENANQDMVSGVPIDADPVPSYLKIKAAPGSAKLIKSAEDGKISGVKMNISGNGIDKDVITGKDGTIQIDHLVPGIYTVTEYVSDYYKPQNSQRVTVVSGNVSTVTFNNTLKRGSLAVIKNSEDKMNYGVTFHLIGTSDSGLPVDEYATTDTSGKATFANILIGSGYVISEVDTPIRYVVPANQKADIEWGKVTERTFENVLKKFMVTVTKSDSEQGTPQGDATLKNAVYGIYKGDQLVDTYQTDKNGSFISKEYVCDTDWTVREITPSEGYLLDKSVHKVGADPKNYTIEHNSTAIDVVEDVIKGTLSIIKHTDNGETQIETPEIGATFHVYLKSAGSYNAASESERDILVCDENGYAKTKKLPYGTYVVKQVSGWESRELMDPFNVEISRDGHDYKYLINNQNFEAYIKILKTDAESGKNIPAANTAFQLYNPDGSKVSMTLTYPTIETIDVFYTNSEGYLVTPQPLPYGKGYSVVEIGAPDGYVLNTEPVFFDITQENSTKESAVTVVLVVKTNLAQKGTINITKTGEKFWSVTEKDGVYQPIYKEIGLADAQFEVYADEDIYTLDGTLRAAKDTLIDTITSGADGTAKSKELYLGRYRILEIKAPYGTVIDRTPQYAVLSYAGQEISLTSISISKNNDRQKAVIELTKVLEQDGKLGIGGTKELHQVTFGLFVVDSLTASDGSVIPADGLLEIITVNEDGRAVFQTDLPIGSYYIKELSADEHYQISDSKIPLVYEYAGQDIALVRLDLGEIENEFIRGDVITTKYDEKYPENKLPGAIFNIYADTNGNKRFDADTDILIDSMQEIAVGEYRLNDLIFGGYFLYEEKAPEGFVRDENYHYFEISNDGQVVTVTNDGGIGFSNQRIKGNVFTTKIDADYPENKLSGAVFEIYKDIDGNQQYTEGVDELVGEMTESELGVYTMMELEFGHYLLYEKEAPDKFIRDTNYYHFFIQENNATITVDNNAGNGFLNEAMKGKLKIVKSSSDGKVEGFSFRIVGENYDMIFKTDVNGEIFIDGLRIGKYTVTEIEDEVSAGYKRPEPVSVELVPDEMLTINVHNDKVTVDVPKTGDETNLWIWVSTFAVSAAGIFAVILVNRKKKSIKKYLN